MQLLDHLLNQLATTAAVAQVNTQHNQHWAAMLVTRSIKRTTRRCPLLLLTSAALSSHKSSFCWRVVFLPVDQVEEGSGSIAVAGGKQTAPHVAMLLLMCVPGSTRNKCRNRHEPGRCAWRCWMMAATWRLHAVHSCCYTSKSSNEAA